MCLRNKNLFWIRYCHTAAVVIVTAVVTLSMAFSAQITISQKGKSDCQIDFQWPDHEHIGFIYNRQGKGGIGLSHDGAVCGVTGGIAISAKELKGFLHSFYPADHKPGSAATAQIIADGRMIFSASGSEPSCWSGLLTKPGAEGKAKSVQIITSGIFSTINAEWRVELRIDADTPRMIFSRIFLKFPQPVHITKLYHQLLRANEHMMNGQLTMLSLTNGIICRQPGITSEELPKNTMNDGLFYIINNSKYAGFLADRVDCDYFLMYQKLPDYYASYKTLFDTREIKPGTCIVSSGITCWGESVNEAEKLLEWSSLLRRQNNIFAASMSDSDQARINFIKMLYDPRELTTPPEAGAVSSLTALSAEGSAQSPGIPQNAEKPVSNRFFESGFEGNEKWELNTPELIICNSRAASGNRALLFNLTQAGNTHRCAYSPILIINPAQLFHAEMKVFCENAQSGNIGLFITTYTDSNGKTGKKITKLADASNKIQNWETLSADFTIPGGVAAMQILIWSQKNTIGKYYIDDISVIKK